MKKEKRILKRIRKRRRKEILREIKLLKEEISISLKRRGEAKFYIDTYCTYQRKERNTAIRFVGIHTKFPKSIHKKSEIDMNKKYYRQNTGLYTQYKLIIWLK